MFARHKHVARQPFAKQSFSRLRACGKRCLRHSALNKAQSRTREGSLLVITTDIEFKDAYPWNEFLKAGAYVTVSRGPRKSINHSERR